MSRIRTIKPEICTSETLDNCSIAANLLFDRLLLFCDDGGVHPYSLYRIKTEIFPGRDDFSKEKIKECLQELEQNGLLKIYEVNGKKYLRYSTFQEHQKIDQPTFRLPWENGKIPVKKSKKDKEKLDNDDRDFGISSRKRKDLKTFLIQRDGNFCSYCGSTTRTLTVDHIIPRSKGGTDNTDNLCLACRQCNTSKYNKLGKPRRMFTEGRMSDAEEKAKNSFQGKVDENNTNVDENGLKSNQTVQNLISEANLTSGREGKGSSILDSSSNNNNINDINNIISSEKNQDNNFQGNDENKPGRPKVHKKWTNNNWESIPDDIQAGFDDFYKNHYPKKKARIEGLCTYANMHQGTGATEDERKEMIRAISAQKLEANLKHETGYQVFWQHISTWLKNRRWEDQVDLSTPKSLKREPEGNTRPASKFMQNAINAAQLNDGGNHHAN